MAPAGPPSTASAPYLQLVLCRLANEDVRWAVRSVQRTSSKASTGRQTQLVVYNAGPPLETADWPPESVVRKLQLAGGHESYCYLEHLQRTVRGGGSIAAVTVFARAQPRCTQGAGKVCVSRIERALRAFAVDGASLDPNGYAPIEPAPVSEFWEGLPRTLLCLSDEYTRLSQGRDLHSDAEFVSFSRAGSFAVGRRNLLAAPRGWLRRAHEALHNASAMRLPPFKRATPKSCCETDKTW
jgi:hypothetical protein